MGPSPGHGEFHLTVAFPASPAPLGIEPRKAVGAGHAFLVGGRAALGWADRMPTGVTLLVAALCAAVSH